MTNMYKSARTNMSPRVNYGRSAMQTGRQTVSRSGGNNPGTYSRSTNAVAGGGASSDFFPSGYVYSSQNAANPTAYFYGNMPQSEQRDAPPKAAGAFNNGNVNSSGGGSGQPSGYRAMRQTGQSGGMNAPNNFSGAQPATRQSAQTAGVGNGFSRAASMQNRTAGTPGMQNQTAAPQSSVRQSAPTSAGGNGFSSAAGTQNRTAGMPGMQNRAAAPQSGGLFGGIGGMVKGILGKDPLGSIGKVVNIMKMLG